MTISITIGKSADHPISLRASMLNRHGAIFGATGTGKTVTLKVITERLSQAGVPVFLADIKGDLSGLIEAVEVDNNIQKRLETLAPENWEPQSFPVEFYDIFGEEGVSLRATVSEMGPVLLSRILGLNPTQEGILNICFSVADDSGLLLIDIKDLRAMLNYVDDHKQELKERYGNIASSSVGAILRSLLILEEQGGEFFLGEPAFEIEDFLRVDEKGRGVVNVLSARKLFTTPQLYATFLLWLLTDLYQSLPEVGDAEKPVVAFFFDEAHLLFSDLSKHLQAQIEQIIRMARSKGIAIFFITQSPMDIPESVLGQCGNKIQHALRAYTPKEKEAIKKIAATFRENPSIDVEETITALGVGEALVSVLDESGIPLPVERALIYPPMSRIKPVDAFTINRAMNNSIIADKYRESVDRESAYELIEDQKQRAAEEALEAQRLEEEEKERQLALREEEKRRKEQLKLEEREAVRRQREASKPTRGQKFADNLINSIGREFGRQITRSVLGIFKKR